MMELIGFYMYYTYHKFDIRTSIFISVKTNHDVITFIFTQIIIFWYGVGTSVSYISFHTQILIKPRHLSPKIEKIVIEIILNKK